MRPLGILAALTLVVAVVPASDAGAACGGPPCGWIDPVLDLRIPEKPPCSAPLGQAPPPETCMDVPADGASVSFDGTILWWWDVSQEGTYMMDPAEDVLISFEGTKSAPGWLRFAVEPSTFTLTNEELLDPDNYRQVEQEGSDVPALWFWYERPVQVTIARDGAPDAQGLDDLAGRDGIQSLFVKARSTASGDRFRAAYGIEEFRFDARDSDLVDRTTPAVPFALAGALLLLSARRRSSR